MRKGKFITKRVIGDRIRIGDSTITVIETSNKKVRLLIEAPDEMDIEIVPAQEADMENAVTRVPVKKSH